MIGLGAARPPPEPSLDQLAHFRVQWRLGRASYCESQPVVINHSPWVFVMMVITR